MFLIKIYCLPEETECSGERKWAAKFFYMCARKRSHEHGLGLVSEVHSGLALPLLTECQLGRDLNGLKWSLQWGVCCRKGELKRGGQAFRRRDRETGRNRRKEKQRQRNRAEHIYRFTCVHEWISLSSFGWGLTLCFVLSLTDWYDSFTGCRRLLGPTDCEKLRYPNERNR